jgi:hypothetical protein
MHNEVESTDRKPADYFFFGVTALGAIVNSAGVVMLSDRVDLAGMALIVVGLAYFVVAD